MLTLLFWNIGKQLNDKFPGIRDPLIISHSLHSNQIIQTMSPSKPTQIDHVYFIINAKKNHPGLNSTMGIDYRFTLSLIEILTWPTMFKYGIWNMYLIFSTSCYRLWLLLCLVVVAFPPGKSFFRYFVSFLRRQLSGTPSDLASRQYIEWCLDNCNHIHTGLWSGQKHSSILFAFSQLRVSSKSPPRTC